MGHSTASDAANLARVGDISLQRAVAMNLQSNHYPPIPTAYVEPVTEAIAAAQDDDADRLICINGVESTGMLPRQAETDEDGIITVPARVLLDITHSWVFVEQDDEPYGDEDEDWDLDGPAHVREA
ncbi:hypothetical protein [Terracoccus sp. 273MFTsu3.1]|uniref:hypothetical protein n=1 Tax=Terracoccus sp. 273MFTsu3.1 TaxID=1172188 RepID=UPI00035C2D80|nr:hypothetical protein [Terracoccus sp. 273MFTsu3.1]